jgi:hypothetical protein
MQERRRAPALLIPGEVRGARPRPRQRRARARQQRTLGVPQRHLEPEALGARAQRRRQRRAFGQAIEQQIAAGRDHALSAPVARPQKAREAADGERAQHEHRQEGDEDVHVELPQASLPPCSTTNT